MAGGILEVLLVDAKGIQHTTFLGRPSYYVLAECGGKIYKTKVSRGKDSNAWWNEKFRFEFPMSHWRNSTHLKLRIMNIDLFRRNGFVGNTTIYLGGAIKDGLDTGSVEVKPSAYNVVLEDDSYKGQMVVGLTFSVKEGGHLEVRSKGDIMGEEGPKDRPFWRSVVKLWKWKGPLWKFLPQIVREKSSMPKKNP